MLCSIGEYHHHRVIYSAIDNLLIALTLAPFCRDTIDGPVEVDLSARKIPLRWKNEVLESQSCGGHSGGTLERLSRNRHLVSACIKFLILRDILANWQRFIAYGEIWERKLKVSHCKIRRIETTSIRHCSAFISQIMAISGTLPSSLIFNRHSVSCTRRGRTS